MTVPGILRALEEASLYRDALGWAHTDADLGMVDGLDAPTLAGLLEKRHAAGHPRALLAVVPTGRRAESLGQALQAYIPDAEVLTFPAWETLPHERLSPSPTRSACGCRRSAASASGRASIRWWSSPPCARPCSRSRATSARSIRSSSPSEDEDTSSTPSPPCSSNAPTRASTWCRAAVSSRCAAASSTSSRPPPTTRSASSSSVTRSIRSGHSRSPISARCPATSRLSTCRPAVSCCSPTRCASGPGPSSASSRDRRDAREDGRGHPRRGNGVAAAGGLRAARHARRVPSRGQRHRRRRPRALERPRHHPRRDEPGVPRRRVERCDVGGIRPDRPGSGRLPDDRQAARGRARPRRRVVAAEPVRRRPRRGRHRGRQP